MLPAASFPLQVKRKESISLRYLCHSHTLYVDSRFQIPDASRKILEANLKRNIFLLSFCCLLPPAASHLGWILATWIFLDQTCCYSIVVAKYNSFIKILIEIIPSSLFSTMGSFLSRFVVLPVLKGILRIYDIVPFSNYWTYQFVPTGLIKLVVHRAVLSRENLYKGMSISASFHM